MLTKSLIWCVIQYGSMILKFIFQPFINRLSLISVLAQTLTQFVAFCAIIAPFSPSQAHNIRKDMVEVYKKRFHHLNLTFSIGGQISFDVFPAGWDKTYCLKFLPEGDWDEIHFFGDKTFQGGNDYEIFTSPRVIGHTVTSPEDTMTQCTKLFMV